MTFRQLALFFICSIISTSCGMGLKISKLTPGNSAIPEVARAFITKWDTTKTGNVVSDSSSIQLPLVNGCTYNFTVDWGDGSPIQTITTWNDSNKTHTYGASGIKTVEMLGTIGCLNFDADANGVSDGDASKLIDVIQWGSNQWTTMEAMFQDADQLTSFSATDVPDLSQVTSMVGTFKRCSLFNGNLNNWDTSNVTSMDGMFESAVLFNQDIGGWNTQNVQGMNNMFAFASAFNQHIGEWDTSQVRDMGGMFRGAISFNQNIRYWITSQVINMNLMFQGARDFNQYIGEWDTSSVEFMTRMFANTNNFNQDISEWETSNVLNMDSMFELATSFSQNLSDWSLSPLVSYTNFNLGNTLLIPPNF